MFPHCCTVFQFVGQVRAMSSRHGVNIVTAGAGAGAGAGRRCASCPPPNLFPILYPLPLVDHHSSVCRLESAGTGTANDTCASTPAGEARDLHPPRERSRIFLFLHQACLLSLLAPRFSLPAFRHLRFTICVSPACVSLHCPC